MKPEMTRQTDEQRVRDVIEAQISALSSKDVKGTIEVYDMDNIMYTLAPPLQPEHRDEASAAEAVQKWFDTWKSPPQYETRDLKITVSGDLALSTSIRHLMGEQNEKQVDLWFRKTLGLKRIDGEWKIIHDHESVPFYMDSLKAAIDLKP